MASKGKTASTSAAAVAGGASSDPSPHSPRTTNVATSTLVKLAFFTIAMIFFPIGTYFITVDRYFEGNATYAGISAAVMANVVLIGYVIAAILEDNQSHRPTDSIKKQQ
ncbi:hypothetical protein B0O80DRAFT_282146 [Mortierella sp. GBAus27b]|nr:vacuolar ATPase assembly integral membrane protein vma21 [Mortierella sp. GBA43]KAI8345499.1 hypothetical protein B0O80DRAFT_282146 [Mortierella sp. GBAus27b]